LPVPTNVFEAHQPRDYLDVRDDIKNGDVILFSGTEIFSHLIQWGTRTPWSHVGFAFWIPQIERLMVLQAVTSGCCAVPLSSIVKGVGAHQRPYNGRLVVARHDRFAEVATTERLKDMSQFAADRFGAPYGGGEIIKIGLRIGAGWLKLKMPKMLAPDDEYICSEYAWACYHRVGIDIPWDGLGFIAPSDFAAAEQVNPVFVIRTVGK